MKSADQDIDSPLNQPTIYQEEVADPDRAVCVTTTLHGQGMAWIRVQGRGCTAGMKAAAQCFESALGYLDSSQRLKIGVDLSELTGASLKGQLRLVQWMIEHQRYIEYIGVVGGSTSALKIAEAVVALLPFQKRIEFHDAIEPIVRRLEIANNTSRTPDHPKSCS